MASVDHRDSGLADRMKATDEIVVTVHCLKCGCGHMVSAIRQEAAQSMMLEHLLYAHRGETEAA